MVKEEYLTRDIKTYVKRTFTYSATNEQVYTYIVKISSHILFKVLDPTTRKITIKIVNQLLISARVTLISKPSEKHINYNFIL